MVSSTAADTAITACGHFEQVTNAANSQGIQLLLDAEKEAAKIVQKARQHRVQRLKEARTEAAKDIEDLRTQKQKDLEDYQQRHAGDAAAEEKRINEETEQKLEEVRAAFAKNRDEVMEKILNAVISVAPKVHANVRTE
ncbi:H+-ATPase G subunit-domain-containing protein [Thamnocephalis sphaerospora]|uniref:V-type proton ATPase subunit G n=1 Tax=Thamnocephalis sphaerospora TaxID=78915 RepID=A0A4P9XUI7_9FUNG|nr:H+-ATPase G subunit-domain-containing protein [Thamnocephalis sphaerospora]|eukprot:RKP09622.1 H+-ATPase G subunit-domain-containing protein [Thamnocephalis sphaerospora]